MNFVLYAVWGFRQYYQILPFVNLNMEKCSIFAVIDVYQFLKNIFHIYIRIKMSTTKFIQEKYDKQARSYDKIQFMMDSMDV